jgi:hypothetical protein
MNFVLDLFFFSDRFVSLMSLIYSLSSWKCYLFSLMLSYFFLQMYDLTIYSIVLGA